MELRVTLYTAVVKALDVHKGESHVLEIPVEFKNQGESAQDDLWSWSFPLINQYQSAFLVPLATAKEQVLKIVEGLGFKVLVDEE